MFVNNFQARRTKQKIDQPKKRKNTFYEKACAPCNKTYKNCTMQNTPQDKTYAIWSLGAIFNFINVFFFFNEIPSWVSKVIISFGQTKGLIKGFENLEFFGHKLNVFF
jgi:abortive infection bacteriophage resistance protein